MTSDDLARRYADAYTAFGPDTLRELPAPHLRLRQVNPGGYLNLDGADASIDTTADFLRFDSHCAATARANVVGHHIATAPPISLTAAGREYLRKHQEFVTVRNVAASFQRG